MEAVLKNPTAPGNEDKIRTAFGQSGVDNVADILKNVGHIKGATMPILTADKSKFVDKDGKPRLAATVYHDGQDDGDTGAIKTAGPNDNLFSHAVLGSPFYDKLGKDDQAGTIIHEAAHWAAWSGDHVTKPQNYVISSEQLRDKGDVKNGGCELLDYFPLVLSGCESI